MSKYTLSDIQPGDSDNKVKFTYDGIPGQYAKYSGTFHSTISLNGRYIDLDDKQSLDGIDQTFNHNDLGLIVALSSIVEEKSFPYALENGDIVRLEIPDNWMLSIGARILAERPDSEVFYVKDDELYVDGVKVDLDKECQVYQLQNGNYTYGIPSTPALRCGIAVSAYTQSGCRIRSAFYYVSLLDIEGNIILPFSTRDVSYIDDSSMPYKTNRVARIPVNIVENRNVFTEIDPMTGVIERLNVECTIRKN